MTEGDHPTSDQTTEKAAKWVIDQIENLDGMTLANLNDAVDEELERREMQADREHHLELAEGDLLARRRKCERLLQASNDPADNVDVGESVPYASLEVYRGDDYLQIDNFDGESVALIRVDSLPEEDPERIETLQRDLDDLHVTTLNAL